MDDLDELERAGMYGFEAAQAGLVSNESVKYSLFISEPSDFDTEVFKSDCAFLTIPEIGLEVSIFIVVPIEDLNADFLDPRW